MNSRDPIQLKKQWMDSWMSKLIFQRMSWCKTGDCLHIKIQSNRYRNSLYKDETVLWISCLEIWSLHWKRAQTPVLLKINRSNSKFDEICLCYSLTKTDPITKKFCTPQDHCTVLECAKFHCDLIDVRDDIKTCILTEFEIWSQSL